MQYKIKELLDVHLLDRLLHDFYKIINVPISIVNISGELIVCAGWKSMCSNLQCNYEEFHKLCLKEYWKNNASCMQCEREVSCLNGLKMYRIPVYITDTVIANIFLYKFMEEKPEKNNSADETQEGMSRTEICPPKWVNPNYMEELIRLIETNVILFSDFLSKQFKNQETNNKLLDNYNEMKITYEQLIAINNKLTY